MDCEDIDDKSRDCNNRNYCWFVKKHLDKVNWYGLSQNTSIPVEFFEEHLDTHGSASKLDWYRLSGNTSIVDKPLNIKGAKR